MTSFVRAIASVLIVLASGVTAPDVWARDGALATNQTPDAVRSLAESAQVATATTVARYLLDSRVERERHARPQVLVPSGTAVWAPRISRALHRDAHRLRESVVLSLIRVRAPPLGQLS